MKLSDSEYNKVAEKYPHLTKEQFDRIGLLVHGLNDSGRTSFPDLTHHTEVIFDIPGRSDIPMLSFLNPDSPYLVHNTAGGDRIVTKNGQSVGRIGVYEERIFDTKIHDPWHFFVKEVNGDLVLKLNPQQLCRFFVVRGEKPCEFCFRADTVGRFRNIKAADLVRLIDSEEQKKDGGRLLRSIDEISIITGTYDTEEEYLSEMDTLVRGVTGLVSRPVRTVVGSHEARGKKSLERLKQSGVTVFAFSVEAVSDRSRKTMMNNPKGTRSITEVIGDIGIATELFGEDGAIVRLVIGLEPFGPEVVDRIIEIARYNPLWNLNVYMPFTHYHWTQFARRRPYAVEELYAFMNVFNPVVSQSRQIRFKISP